ncbi:beta-phosphoglucomutase [Clostridium estertheticum]|uniref:Beta-phosphoglucomutase n=1 Tax=Clostridium estertheticum TaxID=238834 RepID=A0A5N7IK65_9CLOT|nr:beta-phosphoglucomutase [Clostridium estertheticum]MBU3072040.1 beta-phosphoglucomutase [Clostridium estertheticum]MBU3162132.1 beta-phosphoglucomutase [Clostridium estertheticum]MBU3184806.1 beta-phosphoglucomutase [Clostridium estertheticum]MPQ30661.1 beta-phosphoglucomutase [Clostridium estertheticum]MPQ61337.1 beta-phosphoglucomutase [Clostridium estertheticum]
MRNIKAIIFDLDGVLVATAKYHYLAWKRLAKELNIEFSIEDNERLKGVSRMNSLDIILDIGGLTLDNDAKIKLAAKKNIWYVEYISKLTPADILPGVIDFLESIKINGLKIALGSASRNSMLILKNLKLTDYFDAIIDGTKVSSTKPNPEVFLKGALALNTPPCQCIVFEDAQSGIDAAINAGMYCIGIGSKNILKKANLVLSGFSDMTFDKLELLID